MMAGESSGGVGDCASSEHAGSSVMYREVGCHRRHLSMYAQLQWRAPDLRCFRQQLRLSTAQDLGETIEAGTNKTPVYAF